MVYLVSTQQSLFNNDLYKEMSLTESLDIINSLDIIQFDTETTGRDPHLCKVLCAQFGNKALDIQIVVDTTTIDLINYKEALEKALIVGQNLKFDLQFLYNYGIIPTRIFDTMIVEQLLYLGYPPKGKYGGISYALNDIADRYLGIYIDKSTRGEIIWRGLDSKVIEYAANDVKYLEDIMQLQIKECIKKECIKGAKLECDFVPVIAYLEWCGIKLDESKWKEKINKNQQDRDKYKIDLDNYIIDNQSNYPSFSKYIYIDRQGDLFNGFNTKPICKINWSSSRQVVEIAKLLGFDTNVVDKKTGESKESVVEKHLKSQKGIDDRFLNIYFKYQEATKVCTTYGQNYLNAINPITGRIHTTFRQLGASSGRMTCGSQQSNTDLAKIKKINQKECTYVQLQTLPADKDTRSAFVSEIGNIFCSCDYSALEARLGADVYNEQSMIDEFLYGGGDMHSLVARACFEELRELSTAEIKKNYPHLRKKAKPVGFAKQFGGSATAIASSLSIPLEEAQVIADSYDKNFSSITSFKTKGFELLKKQGYILVCPETGHKVYWWDFDVWKKRQDSFNSTFWEEYRSLKENNPDHPKVQEVKMHFKASAKWQRMVLNSPTQALGIICLKQACIDFFKYIINNDLFNIVKIVDLIHDEICIEYPETMPEISEILRIKMEEAASIYCHKLPIPAEPAVNTYWEH